MNQDATPTNTEQSDRVRELEGVVRYGAQLLENEQGRVDEARKFLGSIASAQSQGTREQTDWMIAQAREGLRRSDPGRSRS
jgi:hypothetical protein